MEFRVTRGTKLGVSPTGVPRNHANTEKTAHALEEPGRAYMGLFQDRSFFYNSESSLSFAPAQMEAVRTGLVWAPTTVL